MCVCMCVRPLGDLNISCLGSVSGCVTVASDLLAVSYYGHRAPVCERDIQARVSSVCNQ